MTKYLKKPVMVEAMQWDGTPAGAASIGAWAAPDGPYCLPLRVFYSGHGSALHIFTLEGLMKADKGDWIIKGVKGELYPCKPDIFAAIYEEAQHGAA